MEKLFQAALVALMLMPTCTLAQDLDAGSAAYEDGNYQVALKEWRPLAEQGDASAQYNLGVMYENGQGVAQDDAEAVKWSRLAAEQGNADAQTNLGVTYQNGQGVPQGYVSAHMWFNLASANGTEESGKRRDAVSAKMTPADISEALRRASVCMASDYQDRD